MKANEIRCQYDLDMYAKLLNNPDVIRANELIARSEEEKTTGLRRRLLASSVRLSRTMAPAIHKMTDECIEILEAKIPIELYVFPSPEFNAMCFKPEDGRLFVMFSASLLESFTGAELQFVVGHELGHHIYNHHDIPISFILRQKERPDPRLALELFAWSRYAEISADRAGAHCAHDLNSVARALFKLASGLSGKSIQFDLDDFLHQVDDMRLEDESPGSRAPKEDWFTTHPFSPLRVKALKLFDDSEYEREGGLKKAELETAVQGLMSLMEPSYLEGQTETATFMRRLLYAGAIAVADASDSICKEEIELFEQFFGQGEFSGNLDLERLKADLPDRAEKVVEHCSELQRMQVLRDLCLMAQASGVTTSEEKNVLVDIAIQLKVSSSFIDQTLSQSVDPD